ncbi:hypothetical protein GUJ93_ZPchr0006g45502 [Zizania palustris]|uniref:Uncharacterized protein n=1 Tax=Zizania palustris TaxID=103762 RepID=A0A8J5SAB9_ZIZPA|nr:hypothetical protein GUJ93_ZPchr0006g45502 [Zizania palustris]
MSSSSCAGEAGLVAMDCLVVCCCCPCLVLQITMFLFVGLPKKVVVRSKRIILRRWHRRRSAAAGKRGFSEVPAGVMKLDPDLFDDDEFEGAFSDDNGWKERCFAVDDDGGGGDGVWETLIEQEGLFWFGSFWGPPEQADPEFGDEHLHPGLRLPLVLERAYD